MRIDVHAHHFAAEHVDLQVKLGSRFASMQIAAAPGHKIPLDERAGMLAELGIDTQILSAGPFVPYFENVEHSIASAQLGTDIFVDACQRYPGRFRLFASIPLPHVDASIAELDRALARPEVVGVALGCSVMGRPLDDPPFAPVFAELDRRGAVVFLHPVGAGCGPGSEDYGIRWSCGAPVEDTVTALRLVLSGLTTRHPRIRFIVPHLGGVAPFLLQRLDDANERAPEGAKNVRPPSALLRELYYDTASQGASALRCACDAWTSDRILLGTDFPYVVGPKLERSVRFIAESGLPEDAVRAISGGNAMKLLGLA